MTVIACKNNIMAADSAIWCGNLMVANRNKIIRLPDGSLFGCGGHTPVIRMAQEWLLNINKSPKPTRVLKDYELDGLLLRPDGSIWHLNCEWDLYDMTVSIAAAGSHNEFVMGAMYAGATAEQAVKLAVQHGDSAGGPVQVERLAPAIGAAA